MRVTVEDREAVRAVYVEAGSRFEAGVPAGNKRLLVTISDVIDVIDAADDLSAFNVDEDWPNNQDWPNRVNVDPLENISDEEYGYQITDVVLA